MPTKGGPDGNDLGSHLGNSDHIRSRRRRGAIGSLGRQLWQSVLHLLRRRHGRWKREAVRYYYNRPLPGPWVGMLWVRSLSEVRRGEYCKLLRLAER